MKLSYLTPPHHKAWVGLLFSLVLICSFAAAEIYNGETIYDDVCEQNILNTINTSYIASSELAPASNYGGHNLIDYSLSAANGEWVTAVAGTPPQYVRFSTNSGIGVNALEIYIRNQSTDTNNWLSMPDNLTITSYTGSTIHYQLLINGLNELVTPCRNTGGWLGASIQPHCYHLELPSPIYSGANLLINVTDVTGGSSENVIFPEVMACNKHYETCAYPLVFCDDFNYDTPISSTNDWVVLNQDNSINPTFSPIETDHIRIGNNYNPRAFGYYEIEKFPVNYPISETSTIVESIYAPVMSVEFDINLSYDGVNETSTYIYSYDRLGRSCVNLEFRYVDANKYDVYYMQHDGTWFRVKKDALYINGIRNVKFSARFGTHEHEGLYPFIPTQNNNTMKFYFAGLEGEAGTTKYFNDKCESIYSVFVVHEPTNLDIFEFDNFKHYVGYDPTTEILLNTFEYKYIAPPDEELGYDETEDLAYQARSLWEQFGLHSTLSKTIVGILLLILMNILIIGGAASLNLAFQIPAVVYVVLNILMVLGLSFVGLMPFWIVLLLIIAMIGVSVIGALIATKS